MGVVGWTWLARVRCAAAPRAASCPRGEVRHRAVLKAY